MLNHFHVFCMYVGFRRLAAAATKRTLWCAFCVSSSMVSIYVKLAIVFGSFFVLLSFHQVRHRILNTPRPHPPSHTHAPT